ncbi:MAG TPA: C25 family cysteine peptidase, partial [Fibrobacteria bacterium]|nr:C25 family cysteine peptidase [Fibrobacteria bacterium]
FTLEGFTTRDLSVWDAGGRKLTGYRVAQGSSGFTVSLVDSLAGPTRYIASSLAMRDVPSTLLDSLPDLLSPSEGADYIVVTGPELLGSALDSLLAHRRRQGLRTRVVLARHIYQAFGDGSMDPAAIRRFVEHAYRNWPRPAPAYLLLLGETSQWYEKASGSLQVTVVPTQLVDIHGWGVAATDDYFAKVSGDDDIADLYVGRIPVANRTDLSKVVRKILALEARPAGHWANKTLLVSGFEDIFTRQTNRLQALTVARNRQYSRLDLYPKSPYYRGDAGRGGFFSQLDSAFSVVTFVGHGGGAVWSDAGVLTLTHLDEKRLSGDYPIPLVSSITCLTGYFEDVADRSLGEEMVRMDRTGAAAFYGAAGYISSLAGEALAYEVLAAAAGGAGGTAGAVIHQAETMVQLRTGGDFAPILAEFNLLGDPALRLPVPAASGSLDLTPRVLAGSTTLEARGRDLDPREGEGVLTFFLGDSAFSASTVRIDGATFDAKASLAGITGPIPDGKAVLHYWEGPESRIATAPFTTLDWLIDSVRLEPEHAAPGDSARVRLRLGTAYGKVRVEGGIAFYSVAGKDIPPFEDDHQAPLRVLSGETLESAVFQLPAPTAGTVSPNLHVAFRLNVSILDEDDKVTGRIQNAGSRVYSLPLSNLARLAFDPVAFRHPIREEAGIWTVFHNSGLGAAKDFSVDLLLDAESASPRSLTKAYPGSLPLGGTDSLFFSFEDSLLSGKRLRASLRSARPGDLADRRTIQDTVLRIRTRMLASPGDTLR